MSSKALVKFEKTINRSSELIKVYGVLRRVNQRNNTIPAPSDLIRSAVVLAVSALDAYVTEVFSEKLVRYLKTYKPDESLIDLLNEAGLDTRESLRLIKMERPYRRVRTLIERHYSAYTTQRFDVIDKLFLPYRLKDLTDNCQSKSGRKTLKSSVGKLISRRHNIAHDGDYNSHGRLKTISEKTVNRQITDLKIFVKCMDEIICNRI